jgi:S1-C subfamily serine protease
MFENVVHVFRRHFRTALLITLAAAALTFSGTVLVDVATRGVDRRSAEADIAARQGDLEARLLRVEEQGKRAGMVLADLQKAVLAKDAGGATPRIDTPFPLESVVPSLARLVCIDNKDDKTYFTSTGTIVDASGLILTNSHALSSLDGSLIGYCGVGFTDDLQTPPVITYVAKVAAIHKDADLALLQITERLDGKDLPEKFPAITLGDRGAGFVTPLLGATVFIGGYPGIGADTLTFTQGVVSGQVGEHLIKTSALIDSGTSGGAVFDLHGRYIGVATAAVAGEIGGSLGYIVSAGVVDSFLDDYYAGKVSADPVE